MCLHKTNRLNCFWSAFKNLSRLLNFGILVKSIYILRVRLNLPLAGQLFVVLTLSALELPTNFILCLVWQRYSNHSLSSVLPIFILGAYFRSIKRAL
jgi:hypothetical protein